MSQNNQRDPIQKTLGIAALAAIIFAVLYNLLLGGRNGFGLQMYHGRTTGIDITYLLASIVALAVKLLWLALIVIAAAWAFLLIKKAYAEKKVNLDFLEPFYMKNTCVKCGTELHQGWNCCPACGQDTKSSSID